VSRATLASRQFARVGPDEACVTFKYHLTSAFVTLQIAAASSTDQTPKVMEMLTTDSSLGTSFWSTAMATLPSATARIIFFADKIDLTNLNQVVAVDNVTIVNGACPVTGKYSGASLGE